MDDTTTSLTTRLTDLSRNLWWTWHPEVVAIFRDAEPALWREVNHNPIAFVKRLTPEQWSRHAEETVIEIRVNRLSADSRSTCDNRVRGGAGSATC